MTSMVGIGGLPPWYELAEALCVALVIVLPLGWLWAALDYRSRAAVRLRSIGRRPAVPHVLIGMLAASIFFITAEDVLDRGPAEVLSQLNRVVRGAAQELAPRAHVGAVASSVSDLTAAGIAAAVIVTLAGLVMRGRWRDGGWLVVGLLGAWGVSAALKIAFAVARPRGGATRFVITGYGFPSAHVFLTAVACGLLIWSVARFQGCSPRATLYGVAIIASGLIGVARVLVDAHWLTDVIAGASLGVVWLTVVLLAHHFTNARREPAIGLEPRPDPG